jgi:hypothetical protein
MVEAMPSATLAPWFYGETWHPYGRRWWEGVVVFVDLTKRQRRLKLSISHGRAGARRGGWRLVVESMFHETFLQAHQLHPVVSG